MRYAVLRNPLWTFDVLLVDDTEKSRQDGAISEKQDLYGLKEALARYNVLGQAEGEAEQSGAGAAETAEGSTEVATRTSEPTALTLIPPENPLEPGGKHVQWAVTDDDLEEEQTLADGVHRAGHLQVANPKPFNNKAELVADVVQEVRLASGESFMSARTAAGANRNFRRRAVCQRREVIVVSSDDVNAWDAFRAGNL
eukprot:g11841.t1